MHSSTSIAMRFRKSIVVGFIRISPSEMVGNSSGNPPAESTPRLTASATERRCALQLVSSDQELAMPITGRPSNISSLKPSALIHERWVKPSRSFLPNQLWLRNVGVLTGGLPQCGWANSCALVSVFRHALRDLSATPPTPAELLRLPLLSNRGTANLWVTDSFAICCSPVAPRGAERTWNHPVGSTRAVRQGRTT